MKINRETLIASSLFVVFLIALATVSREYRHLVSICLLAVVTLFVIYKMKKVREKGKIENTHNFRNKAINMFIVFLVLAIAYFILNV
jgi:Ca2+/Na+ antiporter